MQDGVGGGNREGQTGVPIGQALILLDTCLLVVGETLLQWSHTPTSEPGDTGLTSDGHLSTLTWGLLLR